MNEQARFWFVDAVNSTERLCLAVAAFTERSAKIQARKQLGGEWVIKDASPVKYAHAWVIDMRVRH